VIGLTVFEGGRWSARSGTAFATHLRPPGSSHRR